MSDEVSGRVSVLGAPAHTAMREAVTLADPARTRPAIARVFGMTPLTPRARSAYREAIGELEVAAALEALGPGWEVLHSVPVGDAHEFVDHLVIGPGGVFVVDTTVHQGDAVVADQRSFTVDDIRVPAIRAMEFEMGRVERLLSAATGAPVQVSGVLAVVEPKSLTVREAHRDVAVVHAEAVGAWFAARDDVLSPERVDAIVCAATKPETWREDRADWGDPQTVREQFDDLRHRVDVAWKVQRLWMTAITAVAVGAFVLVAYALMVGALRAS